ncbi:MAG: lysylphosphatidylglycerol synthase transmembrane domain-containing protein [Gemmatimonadaceae bacterium]
MVDRARLLFWLRLAVGVAILAAVLALVDTGRVWEALKALPPAAFALAAIVNAAGSIVVPAIITSHTLQAGSIRLPLAELVRINLVMRFYVLILPHAVTVGMRWFRYRRQAGQGWQAAALIVFERVVQFAVIVTSAFVFLLAARDGLPPELRILVPVSAALALLALAVFLCFVSRPVFARVEPVIGALARVAPQFVATRVQRLVEAVAGFQQLGNRRVGFVIAWSVAGHLLFVASAWIVCRAMQLPVGFVDIGWMRSAVLLLTVLPITVGGIGVREAGFAGLLYLHGADRAVALAFPLALLAIQLLIGAVGALIELAGVLARRRKEADALH